jgi:hypothetical protein
LKWALLIFIVFMLVVFMFGCTVVHRMDPIKVEKIEVDHKITPIIVRMPWGKDLFKSNTDCEYIDQVSKADLSNYCDIIKKYMYNCCEIDFSEVKDPCTIEFCVEKYNPKKGCAKIIQGCI